MPQNLVIVESPGKIPTIAKHLGKAYRIESCYGHVRNLPKKELGVDIAHGFAPTYVVNAQKQGVLAKLKEACRQATYVYLASDDDREGESISFHLQEVLELPADKVRRIVFREITGEAIKKAIQHPRTVDMDLVQSQQARRIIDRIVGYQGSPVAWRKVKPGLSVGRVQSVAVKAVVERERAIHAFKPTSYYRVRSSFTLPQGATLEAELNERLPSLEEARAFLTTCQEATYAIQDLKKRTLQRNPPTPFITSTLQQEASRLLGFSVSQTMVLAQRLYEAGHITYMRTDGLHLANEALAATGEMIKRTYGNVYHVRRTYKSKQATAQEAHEAIRPTHFATRKVSQETATQRLYNLIWERTIASQMAAATIEKTTATITISNASATFAAQGEILTFDGFLAAYQAAKGKERLLPPLAIAEVLVLKHMEAKERFTKPPARYNEATLVRELEERGIGRPSTYASIIGTIQQRNYAIKEDRPGAKRTYNLLQLAEGTLQERQEEEIAGTEKQKLFPTDTGMVTNDFLVRYFPGITDYGFTATIELALDEIAHQKKAWRKVIQEFYDLFAPRVAQALEADTQDLPTHRLLGHHPTTREPIIARLSRRYGPLVQLGSMEAEEKPRFASLQRHQRLEYITLEEAIELFKLPRQVGTFEEMPITAHVGRYGPYLKHEEAFYSLEEPLDPYTVTEEQAIPCIVTKRQEKAQRIVQTFSEEPNIEVHRGRFGPYIKVKEPKQNIKLPADEDPTTITLARCHELVANPPKRIRRSKKTR